MRIITDDGRFNAELKGGKARLNINLGDFQGEFWVEEMPWKLNELRKVLSKIAEKVEVVTKAIKEDLED